jgi:hypothetical protein
MATRGSIPAQRDPWREEALWVGSLRPRQGFRLGVHVGRPDGDRVSLDVPWASAGAQDAGLRFDLADSLLGRRTADDPFVWLTRPGTPVPHDLDHGWHAAFTRVAGAHEISLAGFRVVTRTGWYDVATGERRVWKRLRALRAPRE